METTDQEVPAAAAAATDKEQDPEEDPLDPRVQVR